LRWRGRVKKNCPREIFSYFFFNKYWFRTTVFLKFTTRYSAAHGFFLSLSVIRLNYTCAMYSCIFIIFVIKTIYYNILISFVLTIVLYKFYDLEHCDWLARTRSWWRIMIKETSSFHVQVMDKKNSVTANRHACGVFLYLNTTELGHRPQE